MEQNQWLVIEEHTIDLNRDLNMSLKHQTETLEKSQYFTVTEADHLLPGLGLCRGRKAYQGAEGIS